MRSIVLVASLAACVSAVAFVACVSNENAAPPASGGDGGAVTPESDAGTDATLDDAGRDADAASTSSSDASDASTSSSDASEAGANDASHDAAPLVCSDAGTGRCLIVLADNQGNPATVLLHGGFVYWIEEGAAGRVQRTPIGGGPIEQLATGQDSAFDMTADDTSLYWPHEYYGTIYSAPLTGVPDGGSPTLLAVVDGGSPFSVTVDSSRIYWTDFNNGTIYAAPLGGITDGGSPTVMAQSQSEAWDITSDGANLYWTINTATGSVMAMSLTDGGAPYAIVPSIVQPTQLQVMGGSVYFIANSANVIYEAPLTGITDGGAPSVLVAAGPDPSIDASTVTTVSFAYDGTTAFWSTSGNGTGQVRGATPGGSATTYAVGMTAPGSVVVDSMNVYWTNSAYGRVLQMAR